MDSEEVRKIAHLARLAVSEEDLSGYVDDLSNILDLVEEMNTAEVGNVSPMAHPLNMSQRLRSDEVTDSNQIEQLLANAPVAEKQLFLVPKVIE